ncbi:hypothetical protein ACFQ6N_30505 [Kitasatospora sp. NPDC056446]|uniref:hypothetical protein n=1 Tax=Kitasatospora sp. NPDC056446 TaxID=3345819 RepID=UPI0036C039D6
MTIFEHRNDADLDAVVFARFCGLIEAAAPLVAELSGLALPGRVTACPVSPAQFIERQVEHSVLMASLAIGSLPDGTFPDDAITGMTAQTRAYTEQMVSRLYPTSRAAIMWREDGAAELTFMPQVYDEYLNPTERQLTTIFAHQLTHLAQFTLHPELAYAPLRCKLLDTAAGLPPEQHRTPAALTFGHGQYVERLASKALCGQEIIGALPGDPEPSSLYTELRRDPQAPTNSPAFDLGEQLVKALVGAGGFPLLRAALTREDLYPTEAEIVDPALWLTRHHAAVESAVATDEGASAISA